MNTMHDLMREDVEAYIAAVEGFGEHIAIEVPGVPPDRVGRVARSRELWVWITDGEGGRESSAASAASGKNWPVWEDGP